MISDVTGKPIVINKNTTAGMLGCGIASSVGANIYGTFEEAIQKMVQEDYRIIPNMKNHNIYNDCYIKYLSIYNSLKDNMHNKA